MCHDCKQLAQRDLYIFASRIMALPDKEKYTKEDLLTPSFLLEQKEGISIYHFPTEDSTLRKVKGEAP